MKLVGTMLVKNEDWVIGFTLRAALQWCDVVIVYDDQSTDSTVDIIREISRELDDSTRLHYIDGEAEEIHPHAWREMQQRQRMLNEARKIDATHVAVVDADEFLTANLLPTIRTDIARTTGLRRGFALPMVSPYDSPDLKRRRIDGSHNSRGGILLAFEDDKAHNWSKAGDGYQHHMRPPTNLQRVHQAYQPPTGGGIVHLQYVTLERLKVKAAWYKAMETVTYPGRMSAAQLDAKYDWTLKRGGEQYSPIPDAWLNGYEDLIGKHYRPHQDPWQLAALKDMVESHGIAPFTSLNLHGVVDLATH